MENDGELTKPSQLTQSELSRRNLLRLTGTAVGATVGGITIPTAMSSKAEGASGMDVEVEHFTQESWAAYQGDTDLFDFIDMSTVGGNGIATNTTEKAEVISPRGLLRYPNEGDTWTFHVKFTEADRWACVNYAVQDSDNYYEVCMNPSKDMIHVNEHVDGQSRIEREPTSNIPVGELIRFRYVWYRNGYIDLYVFSLGQSDFYKQFSFSLDWGVNWTYGGIGFKAYAGPGQVQFGPVTITNYESYYDDKPVKKYMSRGIQEPEGNRAIFTSSLPDNNRPSLYLAQGITSLDSDSSPDNVVRLISESNTLPRNLQWYADGRFEYWSDGYNFGRSSDSAGESSSSSPPAPKAPEPEPEDSLPTPDFPVTNGLQLLLNDQGIVSTNSVVEEWTDQSGAGNTVVPDQNGTPALTTTPTGAPSVRFDGQDDALVIDSSLSGFPTGSSDRTLMAVVKYNSTPSTGTGGVTYGSHSCNKAFGLNISKSGTYQLQGWCGAYDFPTDVSVGPNYAIQTVTLASDQYRHYVNDNQIDSGINSFNTTSDTFVIGAELEFSPYIDMEVAAVALFDRAISNTERDDIESHWESKYIGSTSSNPSSLPSQDNLALHLGTGNYDLKLDADTERVIGWTARTPTDVELTPKDTQPDYKVLKSDSSPNIHAVTFNSTNQEALIADGISQLPVNNTNRSMFIVVKYNNQASSGGTGGVSYGQTNCGEAFGLNVGKDGEFVIQGWCPDYDHLSATSAVNQGWAVQSVIFQDGTYSHYHSTTEIDSGDASFPTKPGPLVVGAELGFSPYIDMEIAAIVVYDKALSTTEHSDAVAYLENKYL